MVSAVNNTTSTDTAPVFSQTGANDVNRQDFLRLLIAQLQHQDPLNPVENQEFVAQLATFSSLEQETNQTKLLQQMAESQSSGGTSQALALIGKDVTVSADSFIHEPGKETEFIFNAPSAGYVPVQVLNSSGQVVLNDVAVASAAGETSYVFQGKASNGQTLPTGVYSIRVGETTNDKGEKNTLQTYLRGAVEGVNFQGGSPVLIVNGQPVEFAQISAVFNNRG